MEKRVLLSVAPVPSAGVLGAGGAANVPPTTTGIPTTVVRLTTPSQIIPLVLYFNDSDGDAGSLTYNVVANNNPDLFDSVRVDQTTDVLTLDPAGRVGLANLTVRATDTGGLSVDTAFDVYVLGRGGGGPVDAGWVRGRVFHDASGDGRRGKSEGPLGGVQLFLDADGDAAPDVNEPLAVTQPDGTYQFPTVPPGTYEVRPATAGWRLTGRALTSGPPLVTAESGRISKARAFGLSQKVLVAGRVFHDLDADGIAAPDDKGLARWRVFLDANGDGVRQPEERSDVTDRLGRWGIADLEPGEYRIALFLRRDWTVTTPGGPSTVVSLPASGGVDADNDFGVI